jgi:hypothetical protein
MNAGTYEIIINFQVEVEEIVMGATKIKDLQKK